MSGPYNTLFEMASKGILLRVFNTLEDVLPVWREVQATALLSPFQSVEWLSTWYHHIGKVEKIEPLVVVAEDAEGILMVLPLQIEPGALRKLTWLGSDLNDYNGPILAADFTRRADGVSVAAVWSDLLREMRKNKHCQFDTVKLEKMPGEIGGQKNPMIALGVRACPSNAYRTAMYQPWSAFYEAKRSKREKSNDRYRRKKLASLGPVVFSQPQEQVARAELVDALIAQKSARLVAMGVANFLAKPGHAAFFQAITRQEPGLIHVSRLDVNGEVAATNLGLTFRNAYYYILTSYVKGEASRFSAGTILLQDVMQQFCDKGYDCFDFTIGDEPYKMEWCDGNIALFDHLDAATLQGRAALAYYAAFQGTKRYIKQTPVLWNAYSKMRGALGARKAG